MLNVQSPTRTFQAQSEIIEFVLVLWHECRGQSENPSLTPLHNSLSSVRQARVFFHG